MGCGLAMSTSCVAASWASLTSKDCGTSQRWGKVYHHVVLLSLGEWDVYMVASVVFAGGANVSTVNVTMGKCTPSCEGLVGKDAVAGGYHGGGVEIGGPIKVRFG